MDAVIIQNVIDWNILRRDAARSDVMRLQHNQTSSATMERERRRFQRNIDYLNALLP